MIFDVVSISIFPVETDAPLWVDPDAKLAMPVAIEGFQAVGRGIFRSSKNASSAVSFSAGSEGAKDFGRVDPLLVQIGKPNLKLGVHASPATGGKAALVAKVREDLVGCFGSVLAW